MRRVGGMIVYVSDQGQAVKFYSEKLGFDIMVNMPFKGGKWIEVAPQGSETTLSLMVPNSKMLPPEDVEAAKNGIGTSTGIWFYSDNIHSEFEELKKKGVDITVPEQQDWGGFMSRVKDPDGNAFSLISTP